MNRIRNVLLVAVLGVGGMTAHAQHVPVAGKAAAAASGSPLAQVQKTNDRIDKLIKSKKSPDDPAAKAEMRSIVNGFLDYEELARRSLARHWESLSKGQRDEFVKTFRELLEKRYEKRLKSDVELKVTYNDEAVKGDEATVSTMVKVKTKGKSTDTEINYKLKKQGDKWMVYDVITDEVSMAKTYREQFDKIITQESFDALLKKMHKRIQEADEGDTKKASAG